MKILSLFSKVLVLALSLTLFACEVQPSVDVNQDKVWVEYQLIYNAPEDETLATAQFRFGNGVGTLLELSDPAQVSFEGQELLFNPVTARYEWKEAGMLTQGTFVYADTDGNTFSNTAPSMVSLAFPDTLGTLRLSKTQDFELIWEGPALAANQGVSVLVGPKLYIEETEGANQITLFASRLQDLSKTTYLGFLERWESVELSEGTTAGGKINTKYQAQRIDVEVND